MQNLMKIINWHTLVRNISPIGLILVLGLILPSCESGGSAKIQTDSVLMAPVHHDESIDGDFGSLEVFKVGIGDNTFVGHASGSGEGGAYDSDLISLTFPKGSTFDYATLNVKSGFATGLSFFELIVRDGVHPATDVRLDGPGLYKIPVNLRLHKIFQIGINGISKGLNVDYELDIHVSPAPAPDSSQLNRTSVDDGSGEFSCNGEHYQRAKSLVDKYAGRTSDLRAANAELHLLLEQTPNCAPAYRELARITVRLGNRRSDHYRTDTLEVARQQLIKAIKIDQNYSDAYVTLSGIYMGMQDFGDAKSTAEQAAFLGSQSPWLYMRMAALALHERDQAKAEGYYLKIVNSPKKMDYEFERAGNAARERLITIYEQNGEYDKADKLYNELIKREDTAWSYGNYASFLLYTVGDYEKSIKESRQALSRMNYGMGRYVLSAGLYCKWAQIAIVQKDMDKAQIYFNEAYKLHPNIESMRKDAAGYATTKLMAEALKKYGSVAISHFQKFH